MPLLALLALHVIVAAWGIRLAAIDAAYHRLPDRLTGSLAIVLAVWAVVWGERPLLMEAFQDSALTTAAYALCAAPPRQTAGLGRCEASGKPRVLHLLGVPRGRPHSGISCLCFGRNGGWMAARAGEDSCG